MVQQHTIGKHCTTVVNNDKLARVTYHGTDVVLWDKVAGTITLNTGGYFTATTKTRMNQALSQWGLIPRVKQKNGVWSAAGRRFIGNTLKINVRYLGSLLDDGGAL